MSDNLALWNSVERTPKEQTKAITGKAYKGTSPKPHYLVHKATETFGPCGIGWGFTIASERIEQGSDDVKVHIALVRVWYKWRGERGEVEHMGQTVFAGKNKNGPFTDEDAPKKSVTDALVKALSMIGFAGDIFMGRYDDSKYVASLDEYQEDTPQNTPRTKAPSQVAETFIGAMQMAQTVDELTEWATRMKPELGKLNEADQNAIRAAYSEHRTKLAEIEYQQEAAE
jgi:hypothetical protein